MMASKRKIHRLGVWGAPVPCVSLPSLGVCLYGQGPFLHRKQLVEPFSEEKLLALTGGTSGLRGIRYSSSLSLVFGGRFIVFLDDATDLSLPLRIRSLVSKDEGNPACLKIADWIWDCHLSLLDSSKSTSKLRLVVATAHNEVQVWHVKSCDTTVQVNLQHILRGSDRSICYCSSLCKDQVAMGTVSNEILVWSTKESDDLCCTVTKKHRLRGHKGVLHDVCFDNENETLLASASDDRSVRLWEYVSASWKERWTAWGHSARVWSVAFGRDSVLSTGEDGTLRSWDLATGAPLLVLRGHSYQSVRSVSSFKDWALSGGNNGTLAIYNIRDRQVKCLDTTGGREERGDTWTASFLLPDDRYIPPVALHTKQVAQAEPDMKTSSEDGGLKKRKKKQKDKPAKQIIVGSGFCCFPGQEDPVLLFATRDGSLMSMDFTGKWTRQNPWQNPQQRLPSNNGCFLRIHPMYSIAAIGTNGGDVVIVSYSMAMGAEEEYATQFTLPASTHRTVQNLIWLEDNVLASFHVRSIVIWTFKDSNKLKSATVMEDEYTYVVLQTGTRGMPSCGTFDPSKSKFVAGDTRGNLSLFDLERRNEAATQLDPLSRRLCAHNKEHVNDIVWSSNGFIYSVGNDGCLVESTVKLDELNSTLFSPIGSFTGITHVWDIGDEYGSSLIVGGYTGNTYSIVNVASGYEYVSLETGGRQRMIGVSPLPQDQRNFPRSVLFVVCEHLSDGRTNAVVTVYGERHKKDPSMSPAMVPTLCSPGIAFHSESIYDLCLVPLGESGQGFALVTASEDCCSTISVYRKGLLLSSKRLPSQVSGVRAVCSSRRNSESESTLIAVGGGKLELQFFLLRNRQHADGTFAVPAVEFLSRGRFAEKIVLDQRINAAAASPWNSQNGPGKSHLVITGDSSGTCSLYLVDEKSYEKPIGIPFYRTERPILCLEMVQSGNEVFVLAGTTGGSVSLIPLIQNGDESPFLCGMDALSIPPMILPLLTYAGHSMGTNAVAVRIVSGDGPSVSSFKLRVCSVGDDQGICCCDIHVTPGGRRAEVLRLTKRSESSLSALKGIFWLDDTSFVTCGYDQRLVLWEWKNDTIRQLSTSPVGVGDVNCLAGCATNRAVAVGGAGFELFQLE